MIAERIRIYCTLASFQPNDDNFSENIGISETRSSDVAIADTDNIIMSASCGMAVINCVNDSAPLKP